MLQLCCFRQMCLQGCNVFSETGTVWENYSPEYKKQGPPAQPNFVGWTGLIPIAVLIEYVFGIKADAKNDEIVWRVNLTERHGIERYPFGGKSVTLLCEDRENADQEPQITVKCETPIKVRVIWHRGEKVIEVK